MNKLLICLFLLLPGIAAAQTPAATATPTYDELKARMERFEGRLKDWPGLGRYAEANSKLAAPAKGENRVVFLGDSITDSWKIAEYFPGKPYINRGIGGQTTPQMLVRFRPDVIDLKPKVVVILAGTNDIAGNTGEMTVEAIENNYRSMAELAKAHGIKVVFASILPISDYNKNAQGQQIVRSIQRQPSKILALNKWLKDYSAANGHVYLDYFSATADDQGFLRADLANDGLHPHADGYKLMAPLAQKAIDAALRK
ncbi:MAG: SGNH/GDSL hydrolase family protein [bacterium]|nr:SGNH/GDSL hydrolase family protein [bacterium]